MSTQLMWLIDIDRPWRAAVQVSCTMSVGRNIVFRPRDPEVRGTPIICRTHYYGTSAFGTKMIADASRRSRMRKMMQSWWFRDHRRESYECCVKELEKT